MEGRAVYSPNRHKSSGEWECRSREAQMGFPHQDTWISSSSSSASCPQLFWLWPIKVWRPFTFTVPCLLVPFKLWRSTCRVLKDQSLIRSPRLLDSTYQIRHGKGVWVITIFAFPTGHDETCSSYPGRVCHLWKSAQCAGISAMAGNSNCSLWNSVSIRLNTVWWPLSRKLELLRHGSSCWCYLFGSLVI